MFSLQGSPVFRRVRLVAVVLSMVVGVAGVSSSSVVAAGLPSESASWLTWTNWFRSEAGLPSITEAPAKAVGMAEHLEYMRLNGGGHTEDPSKPGYTAVGAAAAGRSNIATETATSKASDHILAWMSAPFHAASLLDPDMKTAAFATNGIYAMFSGHWVPTSTRPQTGRGEAFWPGDGTVLPHNFWRFGQERPNPIHEGGCAGVPDATPGNLFIAPVLALLSERPPPGTTMALRRSDGRVFTLPGDLCVITHQNAPDVMFSANEWGVIGMYRAEQIPGTYTATIRQPGKPDISWSWELLARGQEPSRPVNRLAGRTRIETAIETSKARYDTDEADAVVVARADKFPDALVGGPLAALVDGPLLLTPSNSIPSIVVAEINRVLPAGSAIHVLGGVAAIDPAVTNALTAAGYEVVRYAGADRFETAARIADAVADLGGDPTTALLASGTNFPDALAASAAGAEHGHPVLLTNDDAAQIETVNWLAGNVSSRTVCVGGPACAAHPSSTTKLVGTDRYATAVSVADEFFTAGTPVGVASGTDFPDALVAAADTPSRNGPLLLTKPTVLPLPTAAFVDRWDPSEITIYGGSAAISSAVAGQLG